MTKKSAGVTRPLKSTEYTIRLASTQAGRGWIDLRATQNNALVDAWDRLTKDPTSEDTRCHRLKGELAKIERDGRTFERRQYELTGGARLWFFVDGDVVHIVQVHTHHPNQTK